MKINLYLNSVKVKSVKVDDKADYIRDYRVKIFNRKELFGHWMAQVILRPVQLMSTGKEIDLNCVVYQGVNLGGVNE